MCRAAEQHGAAALLQVLHAQGTASGGAQRAPGVVLGVHMGHQPHQALHFQEQVHRLGLCKAVSASLRPPST